MISTGNHVTQMHERQLHSAKAEAISELQALQSQLGLLQRKVEAQVLPLASPPLASTRLPSSSLASPPFHSPPFPSP